MTDDLRILVAGPPGTGKTTVAQVLARSLGCGHIDMETDPANRQQLAANPRAFLALLPRTFVVSWGFGPVTDVEGVRWLMRPGGFRMVWLDGDRVASFRAFMHRERNDPVMEWCYYLQLLAITASRCPHPYGGVTVNPFSDGQFHAPGAIVQMIREALGA